MLLSIQKDSNDIVFKCCGFPVYKCSKKRQEMIVSFLFNSFVYYRFTPFEKSIRLFGIPFITICTQNKGSRRNRDIRLFSFKNFKKDIRNEILANIVSKIPEKYKNYVIIRSAIGETYMLQFFLKEYMKNHSMSFDDTCFVSYRKELSDLFKMYNSDAHFYYVPIDFGKLSYSVDKSYYKYDDANFHVYVNKQFIFKLMDRYKRKEKIHYYDSLLNYFKIDRKKLLPLDPEFTDDIDTTTNNKLAHLNLNYDNFVILAPEALSVKSLSVDFWNSLEELLKDKGYDVYWNISGAKTFKDKKYAKLNLMEIKYLADRAKGIVGMSSGFIETLSRCPGKICVLYTPLKLNNISSAQMLISHSKKLFPFTNPENIYEFESDFDNECELLENIGRIF